jgi:hypothetical protein
LYVGGLLYCRRRRGGDEWEEGNRNRITVRVTGEGRGREEEMGMERER